MTAVPYAGDEATPAISIGQVFREAFDFVRAEPGEFLGATFALALVPAILAEFPDPIGRAFNYGSTVFILAYGAIISTMVYDRACQQAVRFERGARSLRRYRSLLALCFLCSFAIALGLVALVVPGLFLICLWFVASPACAVEQLSFTKALSRSVELTRGNRWRLFGVLALCAVVLVTVMVAGGLAVGITVAKPAIFTGAWFARAVLFCIYSVVISIMTTLLPAAAYVELRRAREGTLRDGVEAMFG